MTEGKIISGDIDPFCEKMGSFLEESGFDDYLWVLSFSCENCNVFCKAIKSEDNKLLFECPVCHHYWEVIQKPIGFSKDGE